MTETHGCTTVRELVEAHLQSLIARSYAPATVAARKIHLRQFHLWCAGAEAPRVRDVTPARLEDYQRWLVSQRGRDGLPFTVATRTNKLIAVRMLWEWAVQTELTLVNPARTLTLPRLPRRLPRAILTETDVERVLQLPNCTTLPGLCDRAIIETLYSTGIRRMEVVSLDCSDVDRDRGTLFVRAGKGDRDRVVPIGDRALTWIASYRHRLEQECASRGVDLPTGALFVNRSLRRLRPNKLTERLRCYIVAAGINKPGSVHIFRHTMATLMHDAGADIRDLQEMLGHAQLSTTEIYTHVSIGRLKSVHRRTHPAEQDQGDGS